MKKKIVYTALAAMLTVVMVSGCSMTGEVTPTEAPVQKPAEIQTVLGDYALIDGHSLYQGEDNAYSIQLPDGAEINEEDPNNVIITIQNEEGYPITVNI